MIREALKQNKPKKLEQPIKEESNNLILYVFSTFSVLFGITIVNVFVNYSNLAFTDYLIIFFVLVILIVNEKTKIQVITQYSKTNDTLKLALTIVTLVISVISSPIGLYYTVNDLEKTNKETTEETTKLEAKYNQKIDSLSKVNVDSLDKAKRHEVHQH